MCPFHIQRNFTPPTGIVSWQRGSAGLIDNAKIGWGTQRECGVEYRQITDDIWIVERINNRNRLTRPICRHTAAGKTDLIETVCFSSLGRRESRNDSRTVRRMDDVGIVMHRVNDWRYRSRKHDAPFEAFN